MSHLLGPEGPNLTPDDVAKQEKICLEYIRSQPLHDGGGATAAETQQGLGWNDRSSVNARFPALRKKGLIESRINPETGKPFTRHTPSGRRKAVVYWPAGSQNPEAKA
ncbi:hypothetical protein ACLM45_12960 [Synechococcus sp. A10-1-5-9]|uniref:hypothetical protein n=1 Tax=Synechococcus sp. A10-1-5-9 TaxID=3392295 RepID=UPI0039E97292